MKLIIIEVVFVTLACASLVPKPEYLPPVREVSQSLEVDAPSIDFFSPPLEGQTILDDDGYHYKTIRRLRNRLRRDVSELTQYLPPVQEATVEIGALSNEYLPPALEEQQTILADDGYHYKTVRRHRQRKRRDVSELTQYLPPSEETILKVVAPSNEYLPPVLEEQQTILADDGYHYKTVRRYRQRKRRDVSELAQIVLPTKEAVIAPPNEYLPPVLEEQQTILADDGYRYKTVRRHRQRKRRDVSELTQYIPPLPVSFHHVNELTQSIIPAQKAALEIPIPSHEYLTPTLEQQQTILANDGYRYKTVKRFKVHRH